MMSSTGLGLTSTSRKGRPSGLLACVTLPQKMTSGKKMRSVSMTFLQNFSRNTSLMLDIMDVKRVRLIGSAESELFCVTVSKKKVL